MRTRWFQLSPSEKLEVTVFEADEITAELWISIVPTVIKYPGYPDVEVRRHRVMATYERLQEVPADAPIQPSGL